MDIFTSMKISASALEAQRVRLNTISSNLANVDTTQTPEGGPYRKKEVVFKSDNLTFQERLDKSLSGHLKGVRVSAIQESAREPKMIHNPDHPDADAEGYVAMPNINVMEEMTDLTLASRSYEANVAVVKASKRMALKALDIGK